MATWYGQYVQVTGLTSLSDLANTTTSSGFSLTPVYFADDQDGDLDDNVGDTINGSEIVVLAHIDGPRIITVDGVDYTVDGGMLGFELANGDFLLTPFFLDGWNNDALRDALHYGGTIGAITVGDVGFLSTNSAGPWYNLQDEDAVHGTTGDDTIGTGYADGSGDAIDGADGDNDIVDAGSGNDLIESGAGNDIIDAGSGDDKLRGGIGNDTLTGADGADTFVLEDGGGADVITDFEIGTDLLDTSGLLDTFGGGITAGEVTVIVNGDGTQTLVFPNGETVTVAPGTIDLTDATTQFASLVAMGVPPCFLPGTLIETPAGPVPVETLRTGDLVLTADRGARPLRWIGRRQQQVGPGDEADKPVLLPAGILGPGRPARDLAVSPQHRILLETGGEQVLVPAVALVGRNGARRMRGKRRVVYYALLLDRHEIVFAENAATESFRPGPMAMAGFTATTREEIYRIYPALRHDPEAGLGPPARRVLTKGQAQRCLSATGEALFQPPLRPVTSSAPASIALADANAADTPGSTRGLRPELAACNENHPAQAPRRSAFIA